MKRDCATAHFLLAPKVGYIQVSDFAEASPSTNAQSGSGIRVDVNTNGPTQVTRKRLHAQSLRYASSNAMQLRFAGRQCDGGLCFALMFHIGAIQCHNASRCRPAGFLASGKVSIHIDVKFIICCYA